ncbi:hypothetical protein AALP_AAs63378U000100 [Arabis alpina]|uniref:Uncharacterized protein n=1 Tax=Arabis alpina TaxID=50452 RepID=A0A087G079_ARAAL|nr:hypothetical protein AALP_AAs63378U000100 [Arabis alpina]
MSHSSSSLDKFLASVLEPRTAGVGDAKDRAEEACSDAGSSSWLRPCSKPRDEFHFLEERNADGSESPLPVDEPISDVPVRANASNSLSCLSVRNAQVAALKTKVGKKRTELKTAKALIVDLYEQFATARAKFEELKGDPQDRMVFQVQREANLDFVKQLLGLIPERKVPKLEDELVSLTVDVEAHAGDKDYFDKLMETLGECLDVVLPEFARPSMPNQDVSLEKLAADAGVADVSGSHMLSESAGGLLQEMRIDSARLLKDLMISEDGCMSFAGEDEVEETTIAAEDNLAEKTKTAGVEKTDAGADGAEKADSRKAGEDEEAHS